MATLAPNDPFARRLLSWFEKLDNLDPLKRPGQPPKPDVRGKDKQLNTLRQKAYEQRSSNAAIDGTPITSNKPYQARKDEHDRVERAARLRGILIANLAGV